jgi:hypothetical protein
MNPCKMVWGTCDGTGAIINVCLGFVPKYVRVFNLEAANSHWVTEEWMNPCFLAITDADEGVVDKEDASQLHRLLLASTGISPYAGGSKLCFLNATHPHWVLVGDLTYADVSEVYVDGHYKRDASTDTAFKSIGDSILGKTPTAADYGVVLATPPGFVIGAYSHMNADTEQLVWMAIG